MEENKIKIFRSTDINKHSIGKIVACLLWIAVIGIIVYLAIIGKDADINSLRIWGGVGTVLFWLGIIVFSCSGTKKMYGKTTAFALDTKGKLYHVYFTNRDLGLTQDIFEVNVSAVGKVVSSVKTLEALNTANEKMDFLLSDELEEYLQAVFDERIVPAKLCVFPINNPKILVENSKEVKFWYTIGKKMYVSEAKFYRTWEEADFMLDWLKKNATRINYKDCQVGNWLSEYL